MCNRAEFQKGKAMNDIATTPRPLVEVTGGKPQTTSLHVAEYFHKRHDNVLQSYDNLECSEGFSLLNFQERNSPDGRGKTQRVIHMTKNGFVFLVMGFTGRRAAKFKEDYIAEFDRMAEQLRSGASPSVARLSHTARALRPMLRLAIVEKLLAENGVINPVPTRPTLIAMLADKTLEGVKVRSIWFVFEDSLNRWLESLHAA